MVWKPGISGNPKGRPKRDKFLTQHLVAELNELQPGTKVAKARGLVRALIDRALGGDVPAIREVIDRVEGKAPQVISGDEDSPLAHHVIIVPAKANSEYRLDDNPAEFSNVPKRPAWTAN